MNLTSLKGAGRLYEGDRSILKISGEGDVIVAGHLEGRGMSLLVVPAGRVPGKQQPMVYI